MTASGTGGKHPRLRFGSDEEPGIRRRGTKRFTYVDERTGKPVSSPAVLDRIRRLAVPPAWTDVWIAAHRDSHLQATGRDARGRKQYRYHEVFTDDRANHKFADLVGFGSALGSLRRRVDRDLRLKDLNHDRVVATVVRLLDDTSLRVGNAQYARSNKSFGLTTLRNRHAVVRGGTIHFEFRGKSSHDFDVTVEDPRLAKIVRSCQHLPGQQLFEYETLDGAVRRVDSADVNEYLGEYARPGATAKTFRTWNATVRAAEALFTASQQEDQPSNAVLNAAIDQVADHLGNTRSVCRSSYVHPAVVDAYLEGSLERRWQRPVSKRSNRLSVSEKKTIRLLK
ncbi:MAG: DNA topoisomerase IB [Ilumatobacteraceae bacterium]